MEYDDAVSVGERSYWQVGDSGWHMLLCWEAGPERVLRTPDDLAAHTVTTTRRNMRTGVTTRATEPRTEADQVVIESEINSYLRDAGVPPRPRGYAWHLLVPVGYSLDDLAGKVYALDERHPMLRPHHTAEAMRAIVAEVYAE